MIFKADQDKKGNKSTMGGMAQGGAPVGPGWAEWPDTTTSSGASASSAHGEPTVEAVVDMQAVEEEE